MLKQRIITALILAPLAVWGIFGLATPGFAWFIGAIVVLAAWEWANLSGWQAQWQRIAYGAVVGGLLVLTYGSSELVLLPALAWWLVAFALVLTYPTSAHLWRNPWVRALMGLLILVPTWNGLVILHQAALVGPQEIAGVWVILYVFCVVWVADIGAYFAGRAWGKKKLAPRVSPGKSWAGVYGGLAAVAALALAVGLWLDWSGARLAGLVALTLVTALVSVVGDLCESMVKRFRGLKDSSQLLPGHGGILDRVDSITAAVPVFTLLAFWLGWLA